MRQFQGRDVVKTTINLGIAGQIELGGNDLPALSIVEFSARAKVSSVKHKFKDDGTVEEITVLTVDPDTFEVVGVAKAAEQGELPLTARNADGPVTAEQTDAVAEQMGLKGPLLVSCEACGHGRGDHGPTEDGDDHGGACLHPSCQCQAYAPFAEPPAEDALEPVTAEGLDHEMAVGAAGTVEATA